MTDKLQAAADLAAAEPFGIASAPATVRMTRVLPGSPERLWAYLTESDKRRLWLAAGPMDLKPGGEVSLLFRHETLSPHAEVPPERYRKEGGHSLGGRITRCEPPRVLAFTWGETSEVCFELSPQGENVLLVVTHRRLPDREQMVSVSSGWHTHLGILADRLGGRTPRPFWATCNALELQYRALLGTGQ